MNLREQFKQETGINWENSQGEPDIDYVFWLEREVKLLSPIIDHQRFQAVCAALTGIIFKRDSILEYKSDYVKLAIDYATELINQLNEGEKK